ncbi:MAG: PDZ domain-containing protein [Acidimicrobiales bacterium]|jgi:Lon-like protease
MTESDANDEPMQASVAAPSGGDGANALSEPGGEPQVEHGDAVAELRATTRKVVGWSALGLLVVLIAAGLLIKVDYVALVPGSARDTEPLIEVNDTDEFPSDGQILFTTVRVRQEPNLFEYFLAKLDDDAELVPAEQILGDLTPEENREVNLELMADSKAVAVAVALEQLGFDTISSDGVVVADVLPETAASVVLEVGDAILSVDGNAVSTALDLIETLKTYRPADTILFEVQHVDGEVEVFEVEVGARDDDPEAAFLGISPQDRVSLVDELPLDVDIESGSVGGPSAGLAFTLAILDQLTPGELTGDNVVAVTGTIAFDGRVGAVGGVVQKTAAVRDMGVRYFIVPSALGEETIAAMRERAGDNLEIIPVDDLEAALAALGVLGGEVEAVEEFASSGS